MQRGDGAAELVFASRGPGSGLAHLFHTDPCRVLFPRAETGHPPTAVLLTISGGLAGGDRLRVSITARDGAAATVTSAAAEKIYRSLGPDTCIDIKIGVERAWLEFLPQETILFEGARLRRHTEIDVAPGARFLGCEMMVFGRIARGETFSSGLLFDRWQIRRAGRLIWADALRLDGDIAATLAQPAAFGGARAVASVVYVSDDPAAHLEAARELIAAAQGRAGVTVVNGVLLARFIGADPALLRRDLIAYLVGLRHKAGGWPASLPRVWNN
jgi:urease accessory protein